MHAICSVREPTSLFAFGYGRNNIMPDKGEIKNETIPEHGILSEHYCAAQTHRLHNTTSRLSLLFGFYRSVRYHRWFYNSRHGQYVDAATRRRCNPVYVLLDDYNIRRRWTKLENIFAFNNVQYVARDTSCRLYFWKPVVQAHGHV